MLGQLVLFQAGSVEAGAVDHAAEPLPHRRDHLFGRADDADRLSPSDERDTSRIPDGGTPGYVTFDLRSGWEVDEDLYLTIGVENLLDEESRDRD